MTTGPVEPQASDPGAVGPADQPVHSSSTPASRPRQGRPARLPFVLEEGPPLLSLVFSAMCSFAMLLLAPYYALPLILTIAGDGQEPGPLALPVLTGSLFEATVGTALLLLIGLFLLVAETWRPFPAWLPVVVSFPVAWFLLVPSAWQYGGPWPGWMVLGASLAFLFTVHWLVFRGTIEAWY